MKGVHLWVGAVLLAVGALGLIGYYFAAPRLEDLRQRSTSDAKRTHGTITVGVDNWIGYFPLCSNRMKQALRAEGVRLRCEDDQANYPARMEALRDGKLDFAVATIDSYLLNGAPRGFPGTIVMVIDQSQGGDAVVARKDRVPSLDALKAASDLKIAFTPGSPSEYLLKVMGAHFDLPVLKQPGASWRVPANGSAQALEKLFAGEVAVAVLWEPDVSRALARPEFGKILGTEDTHNLIVDVLVVNRKLSEEQPELVRRFLSCYFEALRHYRDHRDDLRREVVEASGLEPDQVEKMLGGVSWTNLQQNAVGWFGVTLGKAPTQEGIAEAIEATVDILVENGDFKSNPLPDEDPYRIVLSEPIAWLFEHGVFPGVAERQAGAAEDPLVRRFATLSDSEWSGLREVGTLKVRPVTFQSGTGELSLEGKLELDKAASNLRHYPSFRVLIEGHTGLRGDPEANRALSQSRADTVARYFEITYEIDPARLRAQGKGAAEPLPREPSESDRAYQYRLPRVEMYLVADAY